MRFEIVRLKYCCCINSKVVLKWPVMTSERGAHHHINRVCSNQWPSLPSPFAKHEETSFKGQAARFPIYITLLQQIPEISGIGRNHMICTAHEVNLHLEVSNN